MSELDESGETRGPSLRGAPPAFRNIVLDAKGSGRGTRIKYVKAGWHLAIHLEDYLCEGAISDLGRLAFVRDARLFWEQLLQFFERELPGCMELIPPEWRAAFMDGVLNAIDQVQFPIHYDVSPLLQRE